MELQKPAPDSPDFKQNNASAPNDKNAVGVPFDKVTVNQSQSNGGNVNVPTGVPVK